MKGETGLPSERALAGGRAHRRFRGYRIHCMGRALAGHLLVWACRESPLLQGGSSVAGDRIPHPSRT